MKVWDPDSKRYLVRSHLVWLAAHPGEEVPRGYVIHHLDGNKLNDVIENLECIPLAEHVSRHRRAPELYIEALQRLLHDAAIPYPNRHE